VAAESRRAHPDLPVDMRLFLLGQDIPSDRRSISLTEGEVALPDKTKLNQQRADKAAFFSLQTDYLFELIGSELSRVDQPFADG